MAQPSLDGTASSSLTRVSDLKTPEKLVQKVRQIRDGRARLEREWKLNVSFYKGDQWVWWNKFSGRVETLPSSDTGELPRWRVRLTSNQILPGVQAYIALLMKTKPVISAVPDSGSDRDIKSAQVGEALFEHWYETLHLRAKTQEALLWSALASAGYWAISWDPHAGSSMTYMVDPQGQPILNDDLADIYRDRLQQMAQESGMDPRAIVAQFQKTIYMGDIRVDVFGPHQVFLDPTATSFNDADWAICEVPMSPDEVKLRYGKTVEADAYTHDFEVPLPFANTSHSTEKNVKRVFLGYFKPSPQQPKGRYVVFMEDPDEILYDGPWPFPFTELPLVDFTGPRVPGSVHSEAIVTHARPYQKLINTLLSKIVEHVYLTIRPQMIAPTGSLRQRLTNEPGAIFEFQPVAGTTGALQPQWREMPTLPPYVFQFLEEIQGRIDRLFNLQEVNQGAVPPNVEAGVAIDLLQEAATDAIAPLIQQLEDSLARAGNLMASLAKKFYIEPRLLKVVGTGSSTKVMRFLASDYDGGFSFHAEAGSGLPRTRAGRIARIEQLVQMQAIPLYQAWKHLDIADLKGLGKILASDEEMADRENEHIKMGQPLNPIEMASAVQSLKAGLNPETGQPLQPGDNPEELIHRAGLKPKLSENLQTHLATHALWMNSPDFESLPFQVQQDAFTHYELTLQRLYSIPQLPQPQPVRTTLQLKGTVDPVTAAQILDRSGVPEANAQNLAQPPLDTWVTDDLTKDPVQDSGNTHLDQMQQVQGMVHAEEQHQLATAKAAHEVALAAARSKMAQRQASQPPAKKAA